MTFKTSKGRFLALRDIDLTVEQGRVRHADRPLGLRQVDAAEPDRRADEADERRAALRRPRDRRPGPGARGRVPEPLAAAVADAASRTSTSRSSACSAQARRRRELKRRTHAALGAGRPGTRAEHKRPHEISGGMKQRVGIARALAMEPKVLLLDEPFGALDALTRARLQDELLKIVAATGSTVVMVTHDVDEAVLLSDRIVMMTNGPAATIGEILDVDLPRPRDRVELAENRAIPPLPQGGARLPVPAASARRQAS